MKDDESYLIQCNICTKVHRVTYDCKKDSVNHPVHYTKGGIETIDFIQAKLTPDEFRGYLKGNIIKYTTRERFKGKKEDCEKLAWYAKRLSELE
jgi:hypothetical protein